MQQFTNAECASRGRQGNLAAAPNAMPILQRLREIKEKSLDFHWDLFAPALGCATPLGQSIKH